MSGVVNASYTFGQPVVGSASLFLYQQAALPYGGGVGGGGGVGFAADAAMPASSDSGGGGGVAYRLLASQLDVAAPAGTAAFSIPLAPSGVPSGGASTTPSWPSSSTASRFAAAPAAAAPTLFPYGPYSINPPVLVVAVFTEAASGTSLNATSPPVPVLSAAGRVTLTSLPAFRPGLPLPITLAATAPSGEGLAGATYTLRVTATPQPLCTYTPAAAAARASVVTDLTVTTGAGGIAVASFNVPVDAACCNASTLLPSGSSGRGYDPTCSDSSCCLTSLSAALFNASNTFAYLDSVPRAYSASATYLTLLRSSSLAPVAAGQALSLDVMGTAAWAAGALRWAVFSGGALVASGAVASASTGDSPLPAAGVVPTRHKGALSLQATAAMAPSATLLVWTTTAAGELVANSLPFTVSAALPNPLTASFNDVSVRPRANTSLSVAAAPGSRVWLLAVDKAAALLGAGAAITSEGLWAARAGLAPLPPPPLGWGCAFFARRQLSLAGAAAATGRDVGAECSASFGGGGFMPLGAEAGGVMKRAAMPMPMAADTAASSAAGSGAGDGLTTVGQVSSSMCGGG